MTNKGIGSVQRSGRRFIYRIVDSDPASANYGKVKNVCHVESNAMPTTGTFVIGHFVENNTPSIAAGKVLRGWLRLTMGSAHVLNTDWAACYTTTT